MYFTTKANGRLSSLIPFSLLHFLIYLENHKVHGHLAMLDQTCSILGDLFSFLYVRCIVVEINRMHVVWIKNKTNKYH